MKQLSLDPLNEKKYTKTKGLIHKYVSRVLILLSSSCPEYCSFCFRQRIIGHPLENQVDQKAIDQMIEYVSSQPQVNEVIFSGGEPLMEKKLLLYGLKHFSKLKQVKILRIHSRAPIIKPELVTKELLNFIALSKKPVYFSVHINHPKELSVETIKILGLLRKAGAILLSQTVFLKNFNDDYEVLKKLFVKLTEIGIRPYYLHHCDPLPDNEKYLVPIEKEVRIATKLRKELSGLACPTLVIDIPQGNGKIPFPLDFWSSNLKICHDFAGKKVLL